MGVQPIAPITIARVLPPPPTDLQRFERELRRERTSDVVTEWLNMIGFVLAVALIASVASLAWLVVTR